MKLVKSTCRKCGAVEISDQRVIFYCCDGIEMERKILKNMKGGEKNGTIKKKKARNKKD